MKLFSPERPRQASGRLCYVWQGREVAAVPSLYLDPSEDGSVRIGVMLKVADNSFEWHHYTALDETHLASFITDWRNDPENVLNALFKYRGPTSRTSVVAPRKAQQQTAADDLDLQF